MKQGEMTLERLNEIEEFDKKAHGAPWEVEVNPDDSFIGTFSGKMTDPYDGHLPIVDTYLFAFGRKWPSRETTLEDAWLVVAMRNDIKELIRLSKIGLAAEEAGNG